MQQSNKYIDREQFNDTHFSETTIIASKYEESNKLVRSFQNYDELEQALYTASLACVYSANATKRFSDAEVKNGIKVSADIAHVATLMGYDFNTKKGRTAAYNGIKFAAEGIRGKTIVSEDKGKNMFAVWGPIDSVIYNPDNDGKVYFQFSPMMSKMIVNNEGDFTVYSIMMRNRVKQGGRVNGVRLYEVLKSYLYLAQKDPRGCTHIHYDYVDLRAALSLIDTTNSTIMEVLKDSQYADYGDNDAVAYKRLMAIEGIDDLARQNLNAYKNSEEYKNKNSYSREDRILVQRKYKKLNDAIACQYNEYDDFRKRVLKSTQELFLSIYKEEGNQMDMMFEYKPYSYRGKVIAVDLTVYTIEGYVRREKEAGVQLSIVDYYEERKGKAKVETIVINPEDVTVEVEMPTGSSPTKRKTGGRKAAETIKKTETADETFNNVLAYIMNLKQTDKVNIQPTEILALCRKYDSANIINAYEVTSQYSKKNEINEPVSFITRAIKEGWNKNQNETGIKKNSFNDMIHTEYDFDAIEKKILSE